MLQAYGLSRCGKRRIPLTSCASAMVERLLRAWPFFGFVCKRGLYNGRLFSALMLFFRPLRGASSENTRPNGPGESAAPRRIASMSSRVPGRLWLIRT
jgi:hypothetical protein